MRKLFKSIAGVALVACLGLFGPVPDDAKAQTITIQRDETAMIDFIKKQGFSDVVVTKRSFSKTKLEGCRGSDKVEFVINLLGMVKKQKRIGSCSPAFGEDQAIRALQQNGYTNVAARTENGVVFAIGCSRNDKYELAFNSRGDLIDRSNLGPCTAGNFEDAKLRSVLRAKGYDRISFQDKELPRYVAEACRKNNRVRIQMNKRGEIRRERRIGKCQAQINPAELANIVSAKGYKQVETMQDRSVPYAVNACNGRAAVELLVSRYGEILKETKAGKCQPPIQASTVSDYLANLGFTRIKRLQTKSYPYLIEACQDDELLEVSVGRFGRIRGEKRVGRCAVPATKDDILAKIDGKGYLLPTVTQKGGGNWRLEACDGEQRIAIRYTKFGELRDSQNIGTCPSAKVIELVQGLNNGGANNLSVSIRGCYRNDTYRWDFDALGNRIERVLVKNGCN